MQTIVERSERPRRLRVADAFSRVRRPTVSAALNELDSLGGRESQALTLLVDVIDSALEAGDIRWCQEFLDSLDVTRVTDDVALAPLISSFIARAPLRVARERYAARVRAALTQRGWAAVDVTRAIDDLL